MKSPGIGRRSFLLVTVVLLAVAMVAPFPAHARDGATNPPCFDMPSVECCPGKVGCPKLDNGNLPCYCWNGTASVPWGGNKDTVIDGTVSAGGYLPRAEKKPLTFPRRHSTATLRPWWK